MRLDYFTLLSPKPISLSIGTIKQPTLNDIGDLTFEKFRIYQVYLKLTPSDYYTKINVEDGKIQWDTLSDELKNDCSIYDVLLIQKDVQQVYLDLLNFFFKERVVFMDNLFVLIKTDDYLTPPDELEINDDDICGVIHSENFLDVLDILQQVCCIKSDDPLDVVKPKFKNAKAKMLYDKMLKAREAEKKKEDMKNLYNFTLPNIISATAAKTPGLNIINIWDATLFQLYDQFGKIQNDDVHYINSVRVAVWGDEKNQFDPALWYKNNFNKQSLKDAP